MSEPHTPIERRENKRPRDPSPAPEPVADRQRCRTNLPMMTPTLNPPAATPPNAAAAQPPTQPAALPADAGNPASGTPFPLKDGKHNQCCHLVPRSKSA